MNSREEWLSELSCQLEPYYADHGYPLPEKRRVSCGWPLGGRSVVGICFYPALSADGHIEIFVSPELGTGRQAARTLAHELLHAALGEGIGHRQVDHRL